MALPKKLYKTTIVIWSEYDPTNKLELEDMAREATNGDMFCSDISAEVVDDQVEFPDTEFFGVEE